jgi:hypothetical protein
MPTERGQVRRPHSSSLLSRPLSTPNAFSRCAHRYPGKGWAGPGSHPQFSDIDMEVRFETEPKTVLPDALRNAIELSPGWKWTEMEWKIDHSRPADA